jgi:hypothetical protein
MVVNLNNMVIYSGIMLIYSDIITLENVSDAINYHGIFITYAPGANVVKQYHDKLPW